MLAHQSAAVRLLSVLNACRIDIHIPSTPAENTALRTIVAYEPQFAAEARVVSLESCCRADGRVVALSLGALHPVETESESGFAHLSISLAESSCAALVGLAFRTRFRVEPTLRVARVFSQLGGRSVWTSIASVLEGSPSGSSLKRVAGTAGVSRWTLRRELISVNGANPSDLIMSARGALALGLLASDRLSLTQVGRLLGPMDARSIKSSIKQALGSPWPPGGPFSRHYLDRLFDRALSHTTRRLETKRCLKHTENR